MKWDSQFWLQRFKSAVAEHDYGRLHELRKEVYCSTMAIVRCGSYETQEGRLVTLASYADEHAESLFYRAELPKLSPRPAQRTNIEVVEKDCLRVAVDCGWDEVCVLNMANRNTPGGGVLAGCGAQEEYLFRCSDYFLSLYRFHARVGSGFGVNQEEEQYPLDRNYGAVFSRGVRVFRGPEEEGYPLLERPRIVNMIALPAINGPALVPSCNGEMRLRDDMAAGTLNKLRTLFRVAAYNGQRKLVLGALGCGAFRNPPRHMAEIFRQVLDEGEFAGAFSDIVFAIKEDHNSRGRGNYMPFAEVFGTKPREADKQNSKDTSKCLTKEDLERFPDLLSSAELLNFLLDSRPLLAWQLPHQLTWPSVYEEPSPSSIPITSLPELFVSGRYRYYPGGHGPYRGFLMSDFPDRPVFHVQTHSQVLYTSERVRQLHRLVVTEGRTLC